MVECKGNDEDNLLHVIFDTSMAKDIVLTSYEDEVSILLNNVSLGYLQEALSEYSLTLSNLIEREKNSRLREDLLCKKDYIDVLFKNLDSYTFENDDVSISFNNYSLGCLMEALSGYSFTIRSEYEKENNPGLKEELLYKKDNIDDLFKELEIYYRDEDNDI